MVNLNLILIPIDKSNTTVITALVKDKDNHNKAELMQYKVKTTKQNDSDLEFNSKQVQIVDKAVQQIQKDIIMNSVKSNKLSVGTRIMMDNELKHAKEALECGIYVTWTSKNSKGEVVDCFRIGSKSMCICGHPFSNHEKVLKKNKLASKCLTCKCQAYNFIPQLPEEIGEYWIPYQKNFNYMTWKAKCKCHHAWDEHSAEKFLRCLKCNCFSFNSNFCCVVCNKFWQDHEMLYELEHERYMNKKAIGVDFLPFSEMTEMQDLLYKNKQLC